MSSLVPKRVLRILPATKKYIKKSYIVVCLASKIRDYVKNFEDGKEVCFSFKDEELMVKDNKEKRLIVIQFLVTSM